MPRPRHLIRLLLLTTLLIGAVQPLAGCSRKTAPAPDFVVFASGSIFGQLAPCG